MVRRMFVGMLVAVGGLTVWPVSAAASSTSRVDGGVKFTVGVLPGESTLRAEGKGVTLSKRLTADRVHIRIDVPGDSFEVEARSNGTARLTRKGKSLELHMTAAREDGGKAQRFAAGSRALAGFEGLAAALESSTLPEAQSVLTSFALLHAVRGSAAPARTLARTIKATHAANVKWASWGGDRGPYACFVEYAETLNDYLDDYNSCYLDYGWLPGMQAVCTFEWVLRAELAWFWLISCSGGFPTV